MQTSVIMIFSKRIGATFLGCGFRNESSTVVEGLRVSKRRFPFRVRLGKPCRWHSGPCEIAREDRSRWQPLTRPGDVVWFVLNMKNDYAMIQWSPSWLPIRENDEQPGGCGEKIMEWKGVDETAPSTGRHIVVRGERYSVVGSFFSMFTVESVVAGH